MVNYEEFILKRITELRIKKDVSEKQMSRDIGKAPSYLSSMVKNKSMPSTKVLIEICEYLGITMADFFQTEYENPVLINKIIRDCKKLTDEELQLISNMFDWVISLKEPKA